MPFKFVLPRSSSALALAGCLLAGAAASWLNFPLPWMIGPLLFMAAGKLGGGRLTAPAAGRQFGQVVIGAALGLYFTPAVGREVLSYAPSIVLAALAAVLTGYLSGLILAALARTDGASAFFASLPGGAAEMSVLAERHGAAVEQVALAQSLRILLVVLIVPSAMYWSGAHGSHPYAPANLHFEPGAFALMAAAALASAGLLYRLGLPNAWMLGPLFMVMGLTLAEVPASAIPQALVNVAQALIGCTLGSRFERKFLLRAPRFIAAAAASILGAVLISAAWGMLVAVLTGIPVASAILATAPGGIAEMCITAKVLHLGVPIVTAFHVTRVLLIVTGAPPIYALLRKLRAKD